MMTASCCTGSFCGKSNTKFGSSLPAQRFRLRECVELCNDIIREETRGTAAERTPTSSPSQEIKKVLDVIVIGQERAKRVLSVAVYNHYKRLQTRGAEGVRSRDEVEAREEQYSC